MLYEIAVNAMHMYVGDSHKFFVPLLIMLICSVVLQLLIGLALLSLLTQHRVSGKQDENALQQNWKADQLNNVVFAGIMVLTVLNVFIAAFSMDATG